MAKNYALLLEDSKGEVVDLGEGKRYLKQLVRFGKWSSPNDPSQKLNLDRQWAEKVVQNFKNKVINRIPVPEGHPLSSGELVARNKGELMDLAIKDDGLYGELEIRDPQAASDIENDLTWDVSVSFDPNYRDKRTGQEVGPALLHVGLVNDPYLKDMEPFQALADQMNAIVLSEGDNRMADVTITNTKDFEVKVSYEADGETKEVTLAPGATAEVPESVSEAVKGQVEAAEKPETDEERKAREDQEAAETKRGELLKQAKEKGLDVADDATAEQLQAAIDEAKSTDEKNAELVAENERLQKELSERDATAQYETFLSEGKIVPAMKDAYMALATAPTSTISLSDGSTKSSNELLAELFKAAPKRINFGEQGNSGDEAEKTPWDELSDEERSASERIGVKKEQYNEVNATK